MYIPRIDYSPLYQSIRSAGAARQAGFLVEQFEIQGKQMDLQRRQLQAQKGWFWAGAGVQIAELGMKVFDMVIAQKTEDAKSEVLKAMPRINAMKLQMVNEGRYGPAQIPSGIPRGPMVQSGEQGIMLDPEYEEFVQQQISNISKQFFGFPQVQQYVENSLLEYSASQQISAQQDIAKRTIEMLEISSSDNRNDIVQRAIDLERPELIKEQIDSEYWNSDLQAELKYDIAMDKYWDGVTRKHILQEMHEGGIHAAYDFIDSLDEVGGNKISPEEKVQYRDYAATTYEAEQIRYADEIRQLAATMQQEGKSNYDIAEAIAGNAGIPSTYREAHAQTYRFAGDMEKATSIVQTNGTERAMRWVSSDLRHYTAEERAAARERVAIAAEEAEVQYAQKYSQISAFVMNETRNPELAYAGLKADYEEGRIPAEFYGAAEEAIMANHRTFLEGTYETREGNARYSLGALQALRTEIHQDTGGMYKRMPEMRVEHLERLDKLIKGYKSDQPGPPSQAKLGEQLIKNLMTGVENQTISINDAWALITIPGTPQFEAFNALGYSMQKTFRNDLRNQVLKNSPQGPAIEAMIEFSEPYLESIRGKKNFTDADVAEIATSLERQLVNAVQADPDITEEALYKIRDNWLELTAGKGFDIINQRQEDRHGVPGDKDRRDLWDMQKYLDENEDAFELTVDRTGRLHFTGTTQDDFTSMGEFGRREIANALKTSMHNMFYSPGPVPDPTQILQGFKPMPGGRVSIQPIYEHTPSGRLFFMRAAKKKGEFEIYEILPDGTTSRVELIDPEDKPALTPITPAVEEFYQRKAEEAMRTYQGLPGAVREEEEEETELDRILKQRGFQGLNIPGVTGVQ